MMSELQAIEAEIRRLVREKEDLDQMRADARYAQKFRKKIVHADFD